MAPINPRRGAPNHDLLRARMKAHMSRQQLARRSGLSAKQITKIEKGLVKPRFESCSRLAKALDYEIPDLFDVEELA